jgi:methionyl-tRNA formyltransferase
MQYVFFGSGPVAAKSFQTLRNDFNFSYVVTKTTTSQFFEPYITDETVIKADNRQQVDDFVTTNVTNESLGILIDFGVIISQTTIDKFSNGIINSHFSLLPNLRGADPITQAILRGHKQTGVSLMVLDTGLDTGDIIAQSTLELTDEMYADETTDILVDISNAMLKEFIPMQINGDIVAIPQDTLSNKSTYANKTLKADGVIHTTDTAYDIDRKVKAYQGWPGAKLNISSDLQVTIERGNIYSAQSTINAGDIKQEPTKKSLLFGTPEGAYEILQLKPNGKKSMTAEAFLAGYKDKI